MSIRDEINREIKRMEKSADVGDWLERQSRRLWGGIGTGVANLKYVGDAIGNVPRAFGAKNNWWGDDFQTNSWKDYNKAGWEAGTGSVDAIGGGVAKGLTLGLSDTVNDLADRAAIESERNLHGNNSADRAEKLREMRKYYIENGPELFQRQYGSADPELLEALSKGETGLSDDVSIAQKGGQIAGNLATIPIGNAAIGAVGKGVGAVAGAIRGGEAVAQGANAATQASRMANIAQAIGRVAKPVGDVAKRTWNFFTKYKAPVAGAIGAEEGIRKGVNSGSIAQGVGEGLETAALAYLLPGGSWKAYVPMAAAGGSIGEYGRTGNYWDAMAAGSQSAARDALLGKGLSEVPKTTMGTLVVGSKDMRDTAKDVYDVTVGNGLRPPERYVEVRIGELAAEYDDYAKGFLLNPEANQEAFEALIQPHRWIYLSPEAQKAVWEAGRRAGFVQ